MRRVALWCSLLALIIASLVVGAIGTTASAVDGDSGGVYVPVTPVQMVNAQSSGSGDFSAGETRTYAFAGHGGVPSTGVSAVVVDIAAKSTTATTSSYVTAWAAGSTRPVVSNLYYTDGNVPRSNTAIVPLGTNGSISIYNYTGTTGITVDLQGYFTSTSDDSSTGGFVPLDAPTRIANTATGQGVPEAKLSTGDNLDIQVTGVGDIPSTATSIFANIEVRNATTAGTMRVGAGGTTLTGASAIDYGTNGPYDSGVSIKLNTTTGKMRILNVTGSAIDIKVDVEGYYTSDPTAGSSFHPLNPTNVYSTASSGQTQLPGGATRAVMIAGVGGLPDDGTMGAVALTATVKNWTASGTVTVYDYNIPWPGTTNASFTAGDGDPGNGITSTLMTSVGDGYVDINNTSSQPVDITLTAEGWFDNPDMSVDATDSNAAGGDEADDDDSDADPDATADPPDGAYDWTGYTEDPTTLSPAEQSQAEFTPSADDSGGNFNPNLDPQFVKTSGHDWNTWCPGNDGPDRYDHVSHFSRPRLQSRMVGSVVYLYCGKTYKGASTESGFGLRHIRNIKNGAHKKGFAKLAAWGGHDAPDDWGWWMYDAFYYVFRDPDLVVNQDANRYCYERTFYFMNSDEEVTKRNVVVVVGKSSRRIITSFERTAATFYCGAGGTHGGTTVYSS